MKYYIIAANSIAQYGLKRLIYDIDHDFQLEVIPSLNDVRNMNEQPSTIIVFLTEDQLRFIDQIALLISKGHNLLCILPNALTGQTPHLLRCGVQGIVTDNLLNGNCEQALQQVTKGGTYYSSEIVHQYVTGNHSGKIGEVIEATEAALSRRELEVVEFISHGLSNKEIAGELGISHRTIDAHRRSILKKTGVPNSAALVRYALSHQLIT